MNNNIPILEARNLSKTLGSKTIVSNLCFKVYPGEIYGFLGPNGAGKTTTIRMLTSLIFPTMGDVYINAIKLKENREGALKNIGCIVENPELYKYLTAMENLKQFARLKGQTNEDYLYNLLVKVGLPNTADQKVGTFSLGMRQRLGLAQALIGNPKVLILDEPMNGLDPQGMKDIRDILISLAKEDNMAVFISSHLLHEMQMIADRVGIINNGKIIAEDQVSALLSDKTLSLKVDEPERTLALIVNSFNLNGTIKNGEIQLELRNGIEMADIIRLLASRNIDIQDIRMVDQELEDIFFRLVDNETSYLDKRVEGVR
ncbi:MAG: type transport system ATP-binding protein [Clostridiales bacterium]|jgi:ABC-2 type transport system ATP-binding protein|nr:type transport system ATP-binding protein [Clostridiales bacterium]